MGCRCPLKLSFVIIACITLIFTLLTLVFAALAIVIGSYCAFSADLLNTVDVTSYMASLKLDLDKQVKDLFDNCVPLDATGDLSTYLKMDNNSANFDEAQTLIDGISKFENFKKNLTNADGSEAIKVIVPEWTKFKTGLIPDHSNVVETLA